MFLTFRVITDPAPTTVFFPILSGATRDELDPIKTFSEIIDVESGTVRRMDTIRPL